MGLEEKSEAGLDIEDLVNIYKGHIEDRYQVFYIPAPCLERKQQWENNNKQICLWLIHPAV